MDTLSVKSSRKPYEGVNHDGYSVTLLDICLVDLLVFLEEYKFVCKYSIFKVPLEDTIPVSSCLITCIYWKDNNEAFVRKSVEDTLKKVNLRKSFKVTRSGNERSFMRIASVDKSYRVVVGDPDSNILVHLKNAPKYISKFILESHPVIPSYKVPDSNPGSVPNSIPNSPSVSDPPIEPFIEPLIQPSKTPSKVITDKTITDFFLGLMNKFPEFSIVSSNSTVVYHQMYQYMFDHFSKQ